MAKKITIEDLAVMIKRGFDQIATKDELRVLREELVTKMDDGFGAVNRRIDLLHEDISDFPDIREEVRDLGKRMGRVERKVGVAR